LQRIRDAGCRAGLTLNPETAFELVEQFLGKFDMLLVMTVHPGFGGQPFRADQMEKVRRAVHGTSPVAQDRHRSGWRINPKPPESQWKTAQTSSSPGHRSSFQRYTKAIRELRGE